MNLDIPEFQKTAIIFFIILFFICLFCYYLMYWVQQPNPYTESYVNISDVVQMNNELTIDHPYLKENNTYKWWNAADNPIQVPWKGLQWPIEDDDALKKHNGNFTVSFWIMTHTENEYEFPVFRVLETGSSLNIPGIFLQDNQLYVKTRTDKGNTESSMDSNHKCILQTNRPEFITVSFNNDRCTLYSNGNFKFEHKWSEFPYVLRENDNVVIDVGSVQAWRGSIQRNSYVLHNLTLFHGVLDSGTIASFYTQSKNHYKKTFLRESNGQENAHNTMDVVKTMPNPSIVGSLSGMVDFYKLPIMTINNETTMVPHYANSGNGPMKFPLDSHKQQILYARLFPPSQNQYLEIPRQIQYTDNGVSFAFWVKINPDIISSDSRVFAFGNGKNGNNVVLYFKRGNYDISAFVRNTQIATVEDCPTEEQQQRHERRFKRRFRRMFRTHFRRMMRNFKRDIRRSYDRNSGISFMDLYKQKQRAYFNEQYEEYHRRNFQRLSCTTKTEYTHENESITTLIENVNPYQWYHIVWTLHPTIGWKLFVNGFFYREFTNIDMSSQYTYPTNNIERKQYIGTSYSKKQRNTFSGLLVDFRIIERALTQEDVTKIYENPVAP